MQNRSTQHKKVLETSADLQDNIPDALDSFDTEDTPSSPVNEELRVELFRWVQSHHSPSQLRF